MVRGAEERSGELFSYVDLEARVRADHPLRAVRALVKDALATLAGEFAALYADIERPSSCSGPCCCGPFTRSARSGS
jgi:transposase